MLWIWNRDQEAVLEDGRDVQRRIAGLLEWFLCDAFTYHPEGAKQCWWSDGVIDLRLERISDTAIRASGSTWWAEGMKGQWIAPFEIEFYFPTVEALDFTRTVVRFGWVDRNGRIIRNSSYLVNPDLRTDGRKRKNSDWAMAIELTPPGEESD